jgi:hypothetical protein
MPQPRYFTAKEVDAIVPQLEHIFQHIATCKKRAETLATQAVRPAWSNKPADVAQLQVIRSQVDFLLEAVQDDIRQIESLGGITKDIELGLVDFLGDLNGEDVWLCWRRGETKIRFWHPIDAGFTQRRPLPKSRKNTLH